MLGARASSARPGRRCTTAIWVLIFAALGWFVVLVTGRVADVVNAARYTEAGSIDSHLVRIVLRLVSLVLLVSLVIYAAGFFGIPLTPVIASLGVGGLAIALAVRPTLENVIGGLTLFADKPVRIGDFCRFGSRGGDGGGDRPALDPAAQAGRHRRQHAQLRLLPARAHQLQPPAATAVSDDHRASLRDRPRSSFARSSPGWTTMLRDHPRVLHDKLHVRFDGFGASSLDVAVFVYVSATDWLQYLEVREDINFKIMSIVEAAGTGFAFPSQTSYLALRPEPGRRPAQPRPRRAPPSGWCRSSGETRG